MTKNHNYEPNVLNAFVDNYNKTTNSKWKLKERRNAQEDGFIVDEINEKHYSIELTKITNPKIEERNNFVINKQKKGVGELFTPFGPNEAVVAINKKANKYSDEPCRILVLEAFSCVPFSWTDYWSPVIQHAKNTKFFKIFAIQQERNSILIQEIK